MSDKGKEISRDAENCVICLEPISEKSIASPCHHTYDYLCLLSWLEVRQSCPLCNTTIKHIDVVDRATGEVNQVGWYRIPNPHEQLLRFWIPSTRSNLPGQLLSLHPHRRRHSTPKNTYHFVIAHSTTTAVGVPEPPNQ